MNTKEDFKKLHHSIIEGSHEDSITETKVLLQSGYSKKDIMISGVEKAMTFLDAKCTIEQFNLLEVMLSTLFTSYISTEVDLRGLHLCPEISPSSQSGWCIEDNRIFSEILPLDSHNLRVDEYGVFHPFNTVSWIYGFTDSNTGHSEKSACETCVNKKNCDKPILCKNASVAKL
jgi:hypothetical protein